MAQGTGVAGTEIDLTYLLEMAEGDESFVREVLATYLESAAGLVEGIGAAYMSKNAVALVHAAHTLKGSSHSIGAERFADLCEQIEHSARKEEFASCERAVDAMREAYARLAHEIGMSIEQQAA